MIVGLCGYANSGKDVVAEYLVKNKGFIRMSFAGALKDIVSQLFDWDRNLLEGATSESREWRETIDPYWSKSLGQPELTPRKILQSFGTDIVRNFQSDFWVRVLEKRIQALPTGSRIVISDARFLNEFAFIKSFGGQTYWIVRHLPDYHNSIIDNIQCNGIPNIKVHRSEWEFLMEPDKLVIRNDSDLKTLYSKLDLLFINY